MRQLLILGRNPGVNQLVRDILSHAGFDPRVENLQRTSVLANLERYAAIIIDDEQAVFEEIRQKYLNLPIIFLATATPLRDNARIVLQKPFSVSGLLEAIKSGCGT